MGLRRAGGAPSHSSPLSRSTRPAQRRLSCVLYGRYAWHRAQPDGCPARPRSSPGLLPITRAFIDSGFPRGRHLIAHTQGRLPALSLANSLHCDIYNHRRRRASIYPLLVIPDPLCLINEAFLWIVEALEGCRSSCRKGDPARAAQGGGGHCPLVHFCHSNSTVLSHLLCTAGEALSPTPHS